MSKNFFAALAVEEEGETTTVAPQKKVEKKQEVRPKTAVDQPRKPKGFAQLEEGFELSGAPAKETRGRGERGGRGGFRGGRGGRGGRGERREGQEGQVEGGDRPRGRGYRGRGEGRPEGRGGYRGEGRGYRGRGGEGKVFQEGVEGRGQRLHDVEEGAVIEAAGDSGMVIGERKERPDWRGKNAHYKGKPRQGDHPFDRKSGTGRGRELNKGGHGKGNWGDVKDEIDGQLAQATIEKPITEQTAEEGKEPKEGVEGTPAEEVTTSPAKEEEPEEEETKQLTLEEYLAQKKRPGFKKEARAAEAVKKDNIEKVEGGKQKVETISSNIRDSETYNISTGKNENAVLLGFQGGDDDYVPRERGTRGGRGSRGTRGGQRGGQRTGGQTGGRGGRQQQLSVNEEAFPAL